MAFSGAALPNERLEAGTLVAGRTYRVIALGLTATDAKPALRVLDRYGRIGRTIASGPGVGSLAALYGQQVEWTPGNATRVDDLRREVERDGEGRAAVVVTSIVAGRDASELAATAVESMIRGMARDVRAANDALGDALGVAGDVAGDALRNLGRSARVLAFMLSPPGIALVAAVALAVVFRAPLAAGASKLIGKVRGG